MFAQRIVASLKRDKRKKISKDVIAEQVKQMLQTSDQKLILMVRG